MIDKVNGAMPVSIINIGSSVLGRDTGLRQCALERRARRSFLRALISLDVGLTVVPAGTCIDVCGVDFGPAGRVPSPRAAMARAAKYPVSGSQSSLI